MKTEIDKLKQHHQNETDNYDKLVDSHISGYENDNCDYLIHQRIMSNYHRGAVNALIELEKRIK